VVVPASAPHDYVGLFALERERLLELLRSFAPADWYRPTPCPGWDVLGLTLHLVGDDLSVVARHRDGHHGALPPADLDEVGFIGWLDALQMEWVGAARRISPPLGIELLEWCGRIVADTLAARDGSVPTARVTWASDEPVPAWLDQARELTEYWIHRQQLLQSTGRPSDLRPDLAGPVLDALRWAYPHRLGAVRRPAGSEVEVRIDDEALAREWRLTCDGRTWAFATRAAAPPLATVTMSAEQAWRLLTNNYVPALNGQIEWRGDGEIIEVLRRTRAIIGMPR
jgi:uncharacterized protein (TIGR03083 family)